MALHSRTGDANNARRRAPCSPCLRLRPRYIATTSAGDELSPARNGRPTSAVAVAAIEWFGRISRARPFEQRSSRCLRVSCWRLYAGGTARPSEATNRHRSTCDILGDAVPRERSGLSRHASASGLCRDRAECHVVPVDDETPALTCMLGWLQVSVVPSGTHCDIPAHDRQQLRLRRALSLKAPCFDGRSANV